MTPTIKTPHGIAILAACLLLAFIFITQAAKQFDVANTVLSTIQPRTQVAQVSNSLDNGLIAHYTFDDGTATDTSGHGNNGTVNGATPVEGKIGGALGFDGVDDYVNIGKNITDFSQQFTISAWIKSPFSSSENYQILATNSDLQFYRSGHSLIFKENGIPTIVNNFFPQNDWEFVVVTYNKTEVKLYINGVLKTTNAVITIATDNVTIGILHTIEPWKGDLDDVRIYNRALSENEVIDLYSYPGNTDQVSTTQTLPNNEVTAVSCSTTDVQNAVDSVTSGGTVNVPKGHCVWSQAIYITKPLRIIGAGANDTFLTASGNLANGFFYVNGFITSKSVRISGFYFEMTDWTPFTAIKIADVSIDNLRIDHNTFNQGNHSIIVGGSKGVIDNNYFYNGNLTIEFTAGSDIQAAASWNSLTPGTIDALFIEGNYFIDDNNLPKRPNERIGTYNGGKLVVRFNYWDSTAYTKNNDTDYIFMSHGNAIYPGYYGQPGYRRGQSIVEIYKNIITGHRIDHAIILRGGSNLVYDNIITTNYGVPSAVWLIEEECWSDTVWSPLRKEWPAEDQIHNTFIWNNKLNNNNLTDLDVYIADGCEKTFIQKDRDYFMHAPQNLGGQETFVLRNGAAGTYPTNGSVYPYTGTMFFTSAGPNAYYPYTPYVYPHPLVSGINPSPSPSPTSSTPGDFNSDGSVNTVDFSLMSGAWNTGNPTFDLNKDGIVNSLDFSIMATHWTG